jgi:hypothetical protein
MRRTGIVSASIRPSLPVRDGRTLIRRRGHFDCASLSTVTSPVGPRIGKVEPMATGIAPEHAQIVR